MHCYYWDFCHLAFHIPNHDFLLRSLPFSQKSSHWYTTIQRTHYSPLVSPGIPGGSQVAGTLICNARPFRFGVSAAEWRRFLLIKPVPPTPFFSTSSPFPVKQQRAGSSSGLRRGPRQPRRSVYCCFKGGKLDRRLLFSWREHHGEYFV